MDILVLGTLAPRLVPVHITIRAWSSANDVKNPLCWIGVLWALVSAIALEVA